MSGSSASPRRRRSIGLLAAVVALCLALWMPASEAKAQDPCEASLDVDGDGDVGALTDGLLILRHLFGFTGATLVSGAVDLVECTRCTAPEIELFLGGLAAVGDADDDGELTALTDGLLLLRALFGFSGPALINGAVDLAQCERCTAVAIEVYIENLAALPVEPLEVWASTTVPFDPDCADCEELEETDLLPHLDSQATFLYNEAIDDPIAQWGDCLGSMLECLQADGTVSACAAAAECPAECKALYTSRAPPGADEITLLEVVNGIYVNCGAPCRPLPEEAP
jgi:hypothetical protein